MAKSGPAELTVHRSEAVELVGDRDVSSGSVHLDAMRGMAALLVFSGHTRALYFTSPVPKAVPAPEIAQVPASSELSTSPITADFLASASDFGGVRFASEAVILFFVLSGYLVGGSVLRLMKTARWSWRVYLTKRITRLYVVLVPALILGCALDYIGARMSGPGSIYTTPPGIELITTYQFVERFRPAVFLGDLLFLDNFRVPFIGTNVALWSLSNEFWYYMIFPMLCLGLMWRGKSAWRLLWLVPAIFLMDFTGPLITSLFPLWILGALVSIIPRRLSLVSAKRLSVLGTCLLLAVMVGVRLAHWNGLPAYYVIALVTAFLIYVLAQRTERAKEGVYRRLAAFFSRISYTLYLFHVPMAVFLCALLNSPWHQWEKTPTHLAMFLLSDSVLVACAYGLWRLFEAKTDSVRKALFRWEEPRRSNA